MEGFCILFFYRTRESRIWLTSFGIRQSSSSTGLSASRYRGRRGNGGSGRSPRSVTVDRTRSLATCWLGQCEGSEETVALPLGPRKEQVRALFELSNGLGDCCGLLCGRLRGAQPLREGGRGPPPKRTDAPERRRVQPGPLAGRPWGRLHPAIRALDYAPVLRLVNLDHFDTQDLHDLFPLGICLIG